MLNVKETNWDTQLGKRGKWEDKGKNFMWNTKMSIITNLKWTGKKLWQMLRTKAQTIRKRNEKEEEGRLTAFSKWFGVGWLWVLVHLVWLISSHIRLNSVHISVSFIHCVVLFIWNIVNDSVGHSSNCQRRSWDVDWDPIQASKLIGKRANESMQPLNRVNSHGTE